MRLPLLAAAFGASLAHLSCYSCPQPPPDAGSEVPPELACATLVNATCGASLECGYELACEAARYLAEQDPVGTRCQQALGDAQRYPACSASRELGPQAMVDDCTVLVDVVCGVLDGRGARACADAPACVNAALLANPSQPDADVFEADPQRLARCAAAINEKALYPPCRP